MEFDHRDKKNGFYLQWLVHQNLPKLGLECSKQRKSIVCTRIVHKGYADHHITNYRGLNIIEWHFNNFKAQHFTVLYMILLFEAWSKGERGISWNARKKRASSSWSQIIRPNQLYWVKQEGTEINKILIPTRYWISFV